MLLVNCMCHLGYLCYYLVVWFCLLVPAKWLVGKIICEMTYGVSSTDALIRHWRLTIGRASADCRLIQKNIFCCLIWVIYLGSSCYLRMKDYRVQTEQKCTQKQSCKTHPLLPETEATLMFQQMTYIDAYVNFISVTCSPDNAKTTIGQYQRTNRPIPIIGKTADNRLIPTVIGAGASLVSSILYLSVISRCDNQ